MAGVRFSILKYICNPINPSLKPLSFRSYNYCTKLTRYTNQSHVWPPHAHPNYGYFTKDFRCIGNLANTHLKVLSSDLSVDTQCYKTKPVKAVSPTLSNLRFRSTMPFVSISPMLNNGLHSMSFSSKADKPGELVVPSASGTGEVDGSNSSVVGTEWIDKVKDVWQSTVDAVTYTGQKAKEASDGLAPHVQKLLDTHPYLKDVVVPVGFTMTGAVLAWVVMPRILRRFHKYAMQGSSTLPSGSLFGEQVPYEKSFWGALEDPVRYLTTFMAFTQIGMMVAPTTIASQYITQAWRGAAILSFVWFLHRWKTNVFARALASQSLAGLDREKMLTLDKVSSVGLFVIGIMALAEACGVAVQSILTVGGVGGVATAFAARDILGNVLSGLSMQFAKPFSLGDTIKAGSIEGQVVEMGLTSTQLLNAERFPVLVPNSLFSSQVIVNKSRAQWRAMVTKIPIQIDDLDKIPNISNDIKSMLRSNLKVFLGMEVPFCYLSQIESSFAELTLGCNLKHMSKEELYSTEQDILLQSVRIIKEHGGTLGSAWKER